MKQLLVILTLMFLAPTVQAQADSLEAKIVRFLEVSGARNQFLGAIDNIIALQRNAASADQYPEGFWETFSQEVHQEGWKDIQPLLVEIYRKNYTGEEIEFQLAYFEDPIAQGLVAKQGDIMQQSMVVGAAWGQALGNKITRKLSEARQDKN